MVTHGIFTKGAQFVLVKVIVLSSEFVIEERRSRFAKFSFIGID